MWSKSNLMLSCKNGRPNSEVNINSLIKSDSIDNEIFIFDDIKDISLPSNPVKLEMPIFGVCIEGSGSIEVNLKEYNVEKNTLITLLPDHIIHSYKLSDDFKALFIGVAPGYVNSAVPDIHTLLPFVLNFKQNPIICLNQDEVDSIAEFHAFLWKKIKIAGSTYSRHMIHHLLQSLLYETLDIFNKRNTYAPIKRSRNEDIFYNFFLLVERDFKIDRSVAFYADKLFISPKHLSAVVKTVSGRTAGEWIDNYVILTAKVMLRSSSQTIQEISSALNFANQSFFGKYFKHHVGMSPSEYRAG